MSFACDEHSNDLDGAICVLFEGTALVGTGMAAENIGLVVITLERYFKIVHAIAHRKYYRDWMTNLGVASTWVFGICWVLLPGIGTTRIVNGRCVRYVVWANEAFKKVSQPFRSFPVAARGFLAPGGTYHFGAPPLLSFPPLYLDVGALQ